MEPEKLIGKKIKGFKFESIKNKCPWNKQMKHFIGKVGVINSKHSNLECYLVFFDNGKSRWSYPADQIEAHLVEEEIPTLSDGVMMLVSNDGRNYM